MDIITNIIQTTLDSFDFAYCIIVNILTYFIISTINDKRGHKDMSTWYKRLILSLVILVMGIIYYFTGAEVKTIINSSVLAPVFWSWILKPLCVKFGLDYKDISIFK